MSGGSLRQVNGYCGFCAVHCPVVTTVEGERVLSVEPDRTHRIDFRERDGVPLPSSFVQLPSDCRPLVKRPAWDFSAFASVSNHSATSSKPSERAVLAKPGYISVNS